MNYNKAMNATHDDQQVHGNNTSVYTRNNTSAYTGLFTDQMRIIFDIIFFVVLNGLLGIFGSVFNVINIVVFVKQGSLDAVNISFVALAIADLGSLILFIWQSICMNPFFYTAGGVQINPYDIVYLTAIAPHGVFVRTAWWIKTFITFERVLCIAMPLKVKQIANPTMTIVTLACIFVTVTLGMCPLFIANSIGPMFYASLNVTLISRIYRDDGVYIESIAFAFISSAQLAPFFLEVIFTSIIIQQLQVKSKWRSRSVHGVSGQHKELATRDRKVIKMVVFISFVFIVCSSPSNVTCILGIIYSSTFSLVGLDKNIFSSIWAVILTMEAFNSSINIFIYYNMSARYKEVFLESFFAKTFSNKWMKSSKTKSNEMKSN